MTLLTYRRYTDNCIYLSIYLSIWCALCVVQQNDQLSLHRGTCSHRCVVHHVSQRLSSFTSRDVVLGSNNMLIQAFLPPQISLHLWAAAAELSCVISFVLLLPSLYTASLVSYRDSKSFHWQLQTRWNYCNLHLSVMFGRRPNKPTAVTVTVDCHNVSIRDSRRESVTDNRSLQQPS